MRCRNSLQDNW